MRILKDFAKKEEVISFISLLEKDEKCYYYFYNNIGRSKIIYNTLEKKLFLTTKGRGYLKIDELTDFKCADYFKGKRTSYAHDLDLNNPEDNKVAIALYHYLERKELEGNDTLTLITNFGKNERACYEEAIETYKQQTGRDYLEIREKAYWVNGRLDPKLNALHFKKNACRAVSLSDFWSIYDAIKNQRQLTEDDY